MGRPKKKEYWNQVTILPNNAWKCKRCGREFKGGASRIRAHVDRIEGKGIEVCKRSIDHDQQEAVNGMNPGEGGNEMIVANVGCSMEHQTNSESEFFNLLGVAEGGQETVDANIGGSMDHQANPESMNLLGLAEGGHEMVDANIGCSMDHQSNPESVNLLGGPVPEEAVTQNYNTTFGSEINQVNELIHDLTSVEGDIKEQLEWLESQGKKRRRQVDDWLDKVQDLKSKASYMNDFVSLLDLQRQEIQQWHINFYTIQMRLFTKEVREHKEQKPLVLSNEFVGESFEKHVKKMWELLVDDQVFIIGIHGMGGVGKTCLATYMKNEIKRKGTFKHVFRVTVSRDFSILKLQNDIAERIGAKLYGDDESTRAENLSLALEAKDKSLLILDDVWKNIDLGKVGIPIRMNGIKLILTSRLERVCYQMNCSSDNIIRMYPLSYTEAWELFLLKLGDHEIPKTSPDEVLEIARSIARECDGLPLGLCVMARTMKGVNSIYRWRHTLNKLQNSVMGEEMKEEVFEVLKLSYDNLMERGMQNCFLHCALYDHVGGEKLSKKLFNDGIKNRMRSLTEIFDEGRSIVEELKGCSLLLENKDRNPWLNDSDLRMHGLVRNMACHILKESHGCMVKCHKELTADLELVSLDFNHYINEIPADISPYCPRLSTLILSSTYISNIPYCFFTLMNALAALDLSDNKWLTSLPDSVSDLTSLISLDLRRCRRLQYVPPLQKLQALSRLDIAKTSVEEVQGLENLMNLKWLDLSGNEHLRLTPGFVLPGLTNLQYLNLCFAGSIGVKAEDIQGMGLLESFVGNFHDGEDYNNYVRTIQNRGYGPKTYNLFVGTQIEDDFEADGIFPNNDEYSQTVVFEDGQEFPRLLPTDIAKLKMFDNDQWISLCGTLSPSRPSLRKIEIGSCQKLESLFCSSFSCSLCRNIGNLESLDLGDLGSLIVICKEKVDDTAFVPRPPNNVVFSHLKHFRISCCDKIETLLTPVLLSQLRNLETVSVVSCLSVREIFAVNSSVGDDDSASSITLPKLTELKLFSLPRLEVVCKGIIICGSSPKLKIELCPNYKAPTIQVSL